jgi:putative membrane protein
MIVVANGFIVLIASLHIYFLVLEMFLWTKPAGLKIFRLSLERAESSAVLAANQGLYNGFLAAGLIWSLLHSSSAVAIQLKFFFLSCVMIAGLYGGYSVSRKIAYIQALPAVVAFIILFFA